MRNNKGYIAFIMGSESDYPLVEKAILLAREFSIHYSITVSSAHRTPERTEKFAKEAEKNGVDVIIAVAGGSAHLAGVIASHTNLPVIAVPAVSQHLNGIDSLLSIVQMPKGVPVAAMGIGESGALNAFLFSVRILALKYSELKAEVDRYIENLNNSYFEKASKIEKDSFV